MDTKLTIACDGVWKAMFRAEFNEEEIDTLRALRRLIDGTIALCEKGRE